MDRKCRLGVTGVVAMLLLVTGCGKTIPEPVVVEPEAPRATFTEGSLWPGLNSKNALFSDNKASLVGDIVTVHLIEETVSSNRATTNTSRKQTNAFLLDTGGDSVTEFEFGGGQKFQGSGKSTRSDKLISTISATVIEVLVNGNLKIDGRRKLRLNDEDQYVRVTGMIRPQDINFDNSILSTKIANADISYDGTGRLDKTQSAGFLGKALDKIWPF